MTKPAVKETFAALETALDALARDLDGVLHKLLALPEGGERRVVEAMRHAIFAGGKRLRPFLTVAVADLFGVSRHSALRAGAALECIHTYSLVHDDLPAMDDDDLRRGKPTVHKAFDEATAILAGDALLTLAFEILASEETHADPRVRADLVACVARAAGHHGMVGGQMLDLDAEHRDLSLAEVTRLQRMKTGALIEASVEAGGLLGKAPPALMQHLKSYGRAVGLAFQIADDLLDETASAEEMGKATGKDAAAGKATFVALMGAERARAHAEAMVEQATLALTTFDSPTVPLLKDLARFTVARRR
ncbi:MAG: polyprenyl synthetase family protein [Rhodothalassiaceae bacterium]